MFLALGSIINTSVLSFVDLVVLSTIGAFGILFNYILSVLTLGEVIVWKYDLPAVVFILAGSLVIIFLSDYSEEKYTPEIVKQLVWSTTTLVCFIVAFVITLLTIIQYCWHLRKLKAFNKKANEFLVSKVSEIQSNEADESTRNSINKLLERCEKTVEEASTKERP